MASRNPVLIRATGESLDTAQSPVTAGSIPGFTSTRTDAQLTINDVVMKTAALFGVLLVGAYFGWTSVLSNPSIIVISLVVAFVLAMINTFSKNIKPVLVLGYGAAEGIALGAISRFYNDAFIDKAPNIVSQAVMGTLVAFAVMLALYSGKIIRVNGTFMKVFAVAMISYLVISVISMIASFTGVGGGWGFFGVGQMGLLLCLAGVGLAAFSLVMDFETIQQAVNRGVPERESWRMAFGLTVSLVWLYTELLRLIAIFSSDR